jgi:predicted nucleic acid-binding protein
VVGTYRSRPRKSHAPRVSRCYLDANYLYVHLRSPQRTLAEIEGWRSRVLEELDGDSGVVSALVFDELAYRLVLAWLRDDGDPDPLSTYRSRATAVMRSMRRRLTTTWRAIDDLHLELQTTDLATVDQAKGLMASPGLAPRHAFHAAHALGATCATIVSSDPAFDRVRGLTRLGP